MANIVGQGRSSWLYKDLVKEKKIAIQTGTFNGYPGQKFPNLCAFVAVPAQGKTSEECLAAIDDAIERLKKESVTSEELIKYKRSTLKGMIDAMKSSSTMAAMLTETESIRGDWALIFDDIKDVNAVTAEDVKRVATTYLVAKQKTIGEIIPENK
jgi:predicted Zn-dependent peptidase